ncbi:MAG: tyrosine-type recombinase/integrase [Anaerolineales bacterium]|nr:tyrosine-type recombinase/integrase [Anaerolineales bacterium]
MAENEDRKITPTQDVDPGAFAIRAIQNNPTLQDSTKHQYIKALQNYLDTGGSLLDPVALAEYALTVGSSTRAFLAAAVTRLAQELEQLAKGAATPDNIDRIQAAVFRAQALQKAIRTEIRSGQKAHTWLTAKEAQELLDACKRRASGKPEFKIFTMRDRLAVGLMMAAGLRREEAASLRFEDVKKQNERTVLDVEGKGAKDRVVPINDRLAEAILDWKFLVGPEGFVLRSLGRNKEPGESISTTALYDIVQKRGALIGKPDLQPHDLRRTYAELGRRAGVPIEQISILLGHANIKTTQEYLNIELDLEVTISDFVPF